MTQSITEHYKDIILMENIENGKLYGVYSVDDLKKQHQTWTSKFNQAKHMHEMAQSPDYSFRKNYGDDVGDNHVVKGKSDMNHYQKLINKVQSQIDLFNKESKE